MSKEEPDGKTTVVLRNIIDGETDEE